MSWASKFAKPYRVDKGKKFRLKDYDPTDTCKLHSQEHAEELVAKGVARMAELQDMLYAQNRWGLLLLFQAMDAAGKDGVIKHVMSGPRLPVAQREMPARTRPHRYFQPVLL